MPTLIGIPAGKMIRLSSITSTDQLGLSRLTESYAFASSEIDTFRTRIKNISTYDSIMQFVYPLPSTKYPYLTVDSSEFTEEYGGIFQTTIQYVGILKTTVAPSGDLSWLPPAIQRIQPAPNSYPNYIKVLVDFIHYSDQGIPELSVISKYGQGTSLPTTINGTNLYRAIAPPVTIDEVQRRLNADLAIKRAVTYAIGFKPRSTAIGSRTENVYIGMACTSHFSERIGKYFFKITNTYEDAEVVVSPTLG
jgi:hypothetical protein